MSLFIRCKNFRLSKAVRERIRFRLASAIARFEHRIRDVTTCLVDLNGPKGGVDKQCRLVVRLHPKGKFTIEETDSNLFAAIAHAADRLRRSIGRAVERKRDAKINRNGFCPRSESQTINPLSGGSYRRGLRSNLEKDRGDPC